MHHLLRTLLFGFIFSTLSAFAAERWVGPGGWDGNNGSSINQRWSSLSHALRNLNPGDTLNVLNGTYTISNEPGGDWRGVAAVQRPGGGSIYGWSGAWTTVRAVNSGGVTVNGNISIRGSFIRVQGVRVRGAGQNNDPGIASYDSHHIDILDCTVTDCGGGGINFNHSDNIRVIGNTTARNGSRNTDQHSGISVYQPIRLDQVDDTRYWSIEISRNISYNNQNDVPNPNSGAITDGNGIILDDYRYSQSTYLGNRAVNSGFSRYPGRTLIEGNLCNWNGGSGIQVYESVGVHVKNNTCIGNRQKTEDSAGNYINDGQVSISNSDGCVIVNNVLQSKRIYRYPGQYNYVATESGTSYNNTWADNLLDHADIDFYYRWNNANINNRVTYADPGFFDEANYNYTSATGRGRGQTWGGGHVYTDLYGREVREGQRTDLGALQNP